MTVDATLKAAMVVSGPVSSFFADIEHTLAGSSAVRYGVRGACRYGVSFDCPPRP